MTGVIIRRLAVVCTCVALVAATPTIQARLNDFSRVSKEVYAELPTAQRITAIFDGAYSRDFAAVQNENSLQAMSPAEVASVFQATKSAQFMTDETKYVPNMELDLGELARRHLATQSEYNDMYDAYIGSRMFAKARELRQSHPSEAMDPVPNLDDMSNDGKAGPTLMTVSSDGNTLVRRNVDMQVRRKVIVVVTPWCHFAQRSLRDIASDPIIGNAFAEYATWVVPPNGSTAVMEVAAWNKQHPREQMLLAYNGAEWPMIDRWQLPTFYFFENGKLVSQVVGWQKPQVLAALKKIGI